MAAFSSRQLGSAFGCFRFGLLAFLFPGALLQTAPRQVRAQAPRLLAVDQQPADSRLQPLKDLNGDFPFQPPASADEWQKRREPVRRRVLVSQGLWPMPTRSPLRAVVYGRREMGDYTIEKVYFESLPRFFVTGNLYRPLSEPKGKRPAVLCPHGHWSNGRFYDAGRQGVRQAIVQGAERFEDGGRSHLQSRCVQLARMGCVVFHYDMIGYADSRQISYERAHRFAKQVPDMNRRQGWGLFSPQAEAHLQSVMGLQTYSSVRALDFLLELPEVDPQRLAITGASGGGTQSFMLAAIDDRLDLAVPAVMVSTAMQGGCTCENACLLRVGTGNVEIAALFAPKPLGLTAANDWTVNMNSKGFPQLRQLYKMLGAPQNVMLKSLPHFGHNYNSVSRAAMYSWINQHFQLGVEEPVLEQAYRRLDASQLTVWDAEHPAPPGGSGLERELLAWWTADTQRQLAAALPGDEQSWRDYRELVGGALDVIIGRGLPPGSQFDYEQSVKNDKHSYLEMAGLVTRRAAQEQLPVVFLHPKDWNGRVAIWVHPQGKSGLYGREGRPRAEVMRLLDAGVSVVGVDLLYQGEFLKDGEPLEKTRRVANTREAAAYTFGYNPTLFAQRVHDVLSVISFVRSHEYQPEEVFLIGLEGAGAWAAAARAQARSAVDRAAIDTRGFRFLDTPHHHHPDFLPGGAKYHDLIGMLSLSAPDPLWVSGESKEDVRVVEACYQAAEASQQWTLFDGKPEQRSAAAIDWLLKK